MKPRIILLSALFVMILGISVYSQIPADTLTSAYQEPSLRLSEPVEAVIADLENYIPTFIAEENIPGVAIALIRDGKVVWTNGFGVMNSITAEPVTPGTLFEVASNSKLVTTYIALRLVDQGRLSFDKPLNSYLSDPWLPPSEYQNAITLRHVLSHSSGLGHLTFSRENLFAPGKGYSYSNEGFLYLQAVIEQLTGQSLAAVAQKMVFTPLGMSSSSFVNDPAFTSRTANGHVHAIVPVLFFVIPFLVALVIVSLIAILVLRIWKGHWRVTSRMVIVTLLISFGVALLPVFILFVNFGMLKIAWLILFCGIAVSIALVLEFVLFRGIIHTLFKKPIRFLNTSLIVLIVITLFGLILLSGKITNLPVPKWPPASASAAWSLRATAGDMATFLIELSQPQYLNSETSKQVQSSQISLSPDISWGLGPGIQHSQFGDALWQWGQNIDFQSVLIIYPAYGFGVVVMTNNDLQNPDVAIKIAHRALGGSIDPILRASHLEYNYSEGP